GAGRDADGVAGPQAVDPAVQLQVEHPRREHDALVLALVVLERQRLATVHVQDLAQVAVGDGPAELVPTGLVDPAVLGPPDLRPRFIHAARCQRSPPARGAGPARPRRWPPPRRPGSGAR